MFVNVLCYCVLSAHHWKAVYLVLHSDIDIHTSAFSNFPQKVIEPNKIDLFGLTKQSQRPIIQTSTNKTPPRTCCYQNYYDHEINGYVSLVIRE